MARANRGWDTRSPLLPIKCPVPFCTLPVHPHLCPPAGVRHRSIMLVKPPPCQPSSAYIGPGIRGHQKRPLNTAGHADPNRGVKGEGLKVRWWKKVGEECARRMLAQRMLVPVGVWARDTPYSKVCGGRSPQAPLNGTRGEGDCAGVRIINSHSGARHPQRNPPQFQSTPVQFNSAAPTRNTGWMRWGWEE